MPEHEEKSRTPIAFLAGVGIVILLIAAALFFTDYARKHAPAEKPLVVSEADKPYLAQIQISDIRMSRATNMLGNELTYIGATLTNNGTRTIRDIAVTVEFKNSLNQVVLRETQRPLGRNPRPLPGTQSRDFQLTFEGVPHDWNVQHPVIRITGLSLE